MDKNKAIEKNMMAQFNGLNAIRGIAAIFIFLHHVGLEGYVVTSFGDCFVSFFFILSGFLSTSSCEKRYATKAQSIESMSRFIIRKIGKLYPLYFLCLILALIVKGNNLDIPVILLNAAMLQSWIPNPDIYFSGNSVSWFVSSLMFCYIMFIPMFRLMKNHYPIFIMLSATLFVSYFIVIQFIPDMLLTPIIYISPIMQFSAFLFGMILWNFFKRVSFSLQHMESLYVLCVLVLVAMILLYCYVPERYALSSYWWLIWGVVIYLTAKRDMADTSNFTASVVGKALLAMGRISFPVYMLHTLVIAAYARICHFFAFESPISLTIAITFVASLCLSLAIDLHLYKAFHWANLRKQ